MHRVRGQHSCSPCDAYLRERENGLFLSFVFNTLNLIKRAITKQFFFFFIFIVTHYFNWDHTHNRSDTLAQFTVLARFKDMLRLKTMKVCTLGQGVRWADELLAICYERWLQTEDESIVNTKDWMGSQKRKGFGLCYTCYKWIKIVPHLNAPEHTLVL